MTPAERPIRVLLIDDDPDVRVEIEDLLTQEAPGDYRVAWAATYEAGREGMLSAGHDVCVLDQRLGARTGVALLREVAGMAHPPVIMLTGGSDGSVDRAALEAGAVDYLEKEALDARLLDRALRYAVERDRHVEALRRRQLLLEQSQEMANVGSWEWDERAGEILWSVEQYRIHGLDPAGGPLSLEDFLARVHPDDRPAVESAMQRAREHGEGWRFDHRVVRPDGSVRHVHARGRVERDAEGRLVRMWGTTQDITERKQAEGRLRFQALLLETVQQAVIATDVTGKVRYWNRFAEGLYGWRSEEVLGRPILEVTPSSQSAKDAAAVLQQLLQGKSWSGEMELRRRDGSTFWAEVTDSPIFDASGQLVGIVGVSVDVTERRAALEALRESEERFRALVEHSAVGVWQITPERQTLYANPEMCRMLEVGDPASLIGVDVLDFFTPESAETIRPELAKRTRGVASTYEVELVGRRGARRNVLVNGAPVLNADGRLESLMGMIVDVTAQRRAQEALRGSEEKFASAFHANPAAMAIMSADSCFVDVNSRFLELFGYAREDLIGRGDRELGIWGSEEARKQVHAQVASEGRVRSAELQFRTREGALRTGLYSAEVIALDGVPHVLVSLLDTTERKELEERLLHAQRMESIGRLTGGIAHDFNNLLTSILGCADFLLLDLTEDDRRRDDVVAIRDAGTRAAALTAQLLAFSRRQVLIPRILDLNQLVEESERLLRRVIGEDIVLDTDLMSDACCVEADPAQIQQVILNLVVNARDAMPGGGRLQIGTGRVTLNETEATATPGLPAGRYATITVTDTGMGIDPAVRGRIFEPFFTTKAAGRGTGLGLSTVYGIVRQSGGEVTVESEPGRGSTFRVLLPAVSGSPAEDGSEDRLGPRGSETVLLVEDEEDVRGVVRRILEAHGYAVLPAADGRVARDLFARHRGEIALLLTDVVMPEESGPSLARDLTAETPGLAVLFMSGYTGEAMARHGLDGPGVPFLQKPFTTAGLARKVRQVLDQGAAAA